jgi:hypothetical protein
LGIALVLQWVLRDALAQWPLFFSWLIEACRAILLHQSVSLPLRLFCKYREKMA